MSDFDKAFLYVIQNEGGFVDHPADSGGPTNMGITQKTLSDFLKRKASVKEVRTLSSTITKSIYRDSYWFPLKLNSLNSDETAICIFDSAVLYGPNTAVKFVQICCNRWAKSCEVDEDGIMGEETLDVINMVPPDDFINIYHGVICEHIDYLIEKAPKNEAFRKGWERRCDAYLQLITKSTNN